MKWLLWAVPLVLVATVGCGGNGIPSGAKTAQDTLVLKQFIGRTGILKVKHFFAPTDVYSQDKGEYISPGFVDIGAIIAYQPGREKYRVKGIRIGVVSTYVRLNEYSHPNQHASFLDERDAKDLDAALDYIERTNDEWSSKEPADDVEVTFASTDDFGLSLIPDVKNGNAIYVESGDASISLPSSMVRQLRSALQAQLKVLAANEK